MPIRSSRAIADRLQLLVDDRDRLAAMRRACLQRAAERSWIGYEQALAAVVSPLLAAEASAR